MSARKLQAVALCMILCSMFLIPQRATAQEFAVKTNLLYDATATANLGVEFPLAKKWTMDISGNLNLWKISDNKQWKHWLVQPEARYWFCQRFNGSFVGAHLMGGEFNGGGFKMPFGIAPCFKNNHYEAWYAGLGVVYGYQWILSKHWNFEACAGVGYDYVQFKRYNCGECGALTKQGHYNYFGPTKLALSFLYIF